MAMDNPLMWSPGKLTELCEHPAAHNSAMLRTEMYKDGAGTQERHGHHGPDQRGHRGRDPAGATEKWGGRPRRWFRLYTMGRRAPQRRDPFGPERGHWVMTASSSYKPEIVDANRNPILNESEIYSASSAGEHGLLPLRRHQGGAQEGRRLRPGQCAEAGTVRRSPGRRHHRRGGLWRCARRLPRAPAARIHAPLARRLRCPCCPAGISSGLCSGAGGPARLSPSLRPSAAGPAPGLRPGGLPRPGPGHQSHYGTAHVRR